MNLRSRRGLRAGVPAGCRATAPREAWCNHSASGADESRIEITPEVADGPQSCVLEQVTNGVAIRMALLFLLISGTTEDGTHPMAKPAREKSALHRSKDLRMLLVKNAASSTRVQDRRGHGRTSRWRNHPRGQAGRNNCGAANVEMFDAAGLIVAPGSSIFTRIFASRGRNLRRRSNPNARGGRRRIHGRLLHAEHETVTTTHRSRGLLWIAEGA